MGLGFDGPALARGQRVTFGEAPVWHAPEPSDPNYRPRHVSPDVVIERREPGSAISSARWCVTCPKAGAAAEACCAHKEWLEIQRLERERTYRRFVRPPREGRKGRRLTWFLRLGEREEHAV